MASMTHTPTSPDPEVSSLTPTFRRELYRPADRISTDLRTTLDLAALLAIAVDGVEQISTTTDCTESPDGLRHGAQEVLRALERITREFLDFAYQAGAFRRGEEAAAEAGGQADA